MFNVTVITVSYNAEKEIQKTIESVVNQTKSENIDYIIMDGKSEDDTAKIAEQFFDKSKSNLFDFRVFSEKDDGVYDAMNKAALLAKGDYIIFMNAGDCFADNLIIESFIDLFQYDKYDVIYGDTICIKKGRPYFEAAGDPRFLSLKKPFCHQSAFVKTDIQNNYKFDCTYKIQADYDMFLRAYLDKKLFYKWKKTMSIFDTNGMSSNRKNSHLIFEELKKLHKRNGLNYFNNPLLFPYYIKRSWEIMKKDLRGKS